MKKQVKQFQLTYNLAIVQVEKYTEGDRVLYAIIFSNEIPAITIEQTGTNTKPNWDSVPPGNTVLANAIGSLIEMQGD